MGDTKRTQDKREHNSDILKDNEIGFAAPEERMISFVIN